ncbi:hypothetical protein K439DRAFT_1660866 [Ramaria rubella]|nr:hypothetical protein K439DRAFT_1660866 [Ramaria rubella]
MECSGQLDPANALGQGSLGQSFPWCLPCPFLLVHTLGIAANGLYHHRVFTHHNELTISAIAIAVSLAHTPLSSSGFLLTVVHQLFPPPPSLSCRPTPPLSCSALVFINIYPIDIPAITIAVLSAHTPSFTFRMASVRLNIFPPSPSPSCQPTPPPSFFACIWYLWFFYY